TKSYGKRLGVESYISAKKNHIKIIIKAINFKSIHKTIFLKLILFLHRFKLNDNLVYYGTFLNVSIKNSAVSREDF
ncbi:MAG: hypothetical protein ACLUOT_14325, partial [Bacteroides ovatus]